MKHILLALAILVSFSVHAEDSKEMVKADRAKLKADVKAGASAEQIAADKAALKKARMERKAEHKKSVAQPVVNPEAPKEQ